MPDYKELYLKMMRASEDAIRILINAQQECEELYLQSADTDNVLYLLANENTDKE